MAGILHWPCCTLRPQRIGINLVPFTRSGGRSLGGIEPAIRTDLGFWAIDYQNVVMQARHADAWRTWNAIRTRLGGRSGLVVVCAKSGLVAPYPGGRFVAPARVPHSDGTPFSDGTLYEQDAISVVSVGMTMIGATVMKLRIINADDDLVGVRFSFDHALYETGPAIDIDGDVWTVPVSPSVRADIPDGAELNFGSPTCLCRLADDRGMDITNDRIERVAYPSVSFVEATDYWNRLALGLEA